MDDQALQSLLRSAYQYELPSADAVERFIDEFHRRKSLLTMEPSFLEKFQLFFENFFSHFHVPIVAYVGTTAVAVFLSVLILRSPSLNRHQGLNSLISEEVEAPFNYVSSPVLQQQIEPVTFDLKKKNEETEDVISPLSFILKRKSPSPSLKSF
jgi:hypothetical protein